ARLPSDRPTPSNMPFLQQALDVLVQIPLAHVLGGVVITNDRPTFPIFQSIKCGFSAHSLPCQQAYEVSQEELGVLARKAPRGLVVPLVLGFIHQGINRHIDSNIITNERPDRLVLPWPMQQLELAQPVAPKTVQMAREGCEGIRFDGFTCLSADRPAGELLDDRMVITQLDAPHVSLWVVVIRVGRIEGITTTPDAFPEIELIGRAGLFGLVVDAELDATGRAEHGRFATTVDAGLG